MLCARARACGVCGLAHRIGVRRFAMWSDSFFFYAAAGSGAVAGGVCQSPARTHPHKTRYWPRSLVVDVGAVRSFGGFVRARGGLACLVARRTSGVYRQH